MEIAKDLLNALKTCCDLFNEEGLSYCLIGGLAVGIVSRPRATEDIDFLMTIDERNHEKITALLKKRFDVVQVQDVMRLQDASIWRILLRNRSTADRALIIVDLMSADRDDLEKTLINRMFIELDGVSIPVAAPCDLAEIKRRSGRPQDMLDAEAILADNPDG
jgi:hypothetical protein